MLLVITEFNAWERERWSYILDANKQGAYVLNQLSLFCEMARRDFQEVEANAPYTNPDFFGRRCKLFAASRYWLRYYDEYELNKHGQPVMKQHGGSSLVMNGSGGYKPGVQISPKPAHLTGPNSQRSRNYARQEREQIVQGL
jgi:hypothetical protein